MFASRARFSCAKTIIESSETLLGKTMTESRVNFWNRVLSEMKTHNKVPVYTSDKNALLKRIDETFRPLYIQREFMKSFGNHVENTATKDLKDMNESQRIISKALLDSLRV